MADNNYTENETEVKNVSSLRTDMMEEEEEREPVSYTHLDVYKRQVLYRTAKKHFFILFTQLF